MTPPPPMVQTISVLLDDGLLTLTRAMGALRRRNLPLVNLSIGRTQHSGAYRLTVTLEGDEDAIGRTVNQLRKLQGVREAIRFGEEAGVMRELALIRVRAAHQHFAEVLDTVALYRASVVDEGVDELIVELTASPPFVLSFIRALEPFGVLEVGRSGAVALARTSSEEAPDQRRSPDLEAVSAAEPRGYTFTPLESRR